MMLQIISAMTTDEWIGWQSTPGSPNGIKNLPTVVDANDDGWDVTEAGDPGPQGMLEVDVNRIFQMFRSALLRTHSVYTTLSGFSYAYLGLGNEMGYDGANGFPLGIPISSKPFTGTGGAIHHDMSIFSVPDDPTNATFHFKYIKRFDNNWFAKYWIGELYPDDVYSSQWNVNGNLEVQELLQLQISFAFLELRLLMAQTIHFLQQQPLFQVDVRLKKKDVPRFSILAVRQLHSTISGVSAPWVQPILPVTLVATKEIYTDGIEVGGRYKFPLPTTTQISRPFRISQTLKVALQIISDSLDMTWLT